MTCLGPKLISWTWSNDEASDDELGSITPQNLRVGWPTITITASRPTHAQVWGGNGTQAIIKGLIATVLSGLSSKCSVVWRESLRHRDSCLVDPMPGRFAWAHSPVTNSQPYQTSLTLLASPASPTVRSPTERTPR